MNEEKKKPSRKGRIALIVLCVILALILLLMAAAWFFVNRTLNRINRATEPETTLSQEEIYEIEHGLDEPYDETLPPETEPEKEDETAPVETTAATEPATLPQKDPDPITADHLLNILLIGQDRRPGERRARSDSMILCTVNKETGTLTMTSFLRDTYVKIPGYQDNRINASYALGGMKLLNTTLQKNFGVVVDGNVEVDFGEFTTIIDLLGGVDITLTEAEAKYMGLRAGVNHMDGATALRYARIRKLDNDFGRTNRQRNVLNALIAAYRNKPLSEMLSLLDQILPIVTTDMTNGEIISYAMEVLPMLPTMTIETQYIPAKGTYKSTYIRGMAVLYPDLEANQEILRKTLLGY